MQVSSEACCKNVQFQKTSILSPQKGLEFPGGRGGGGGGGRICKAKKFKVMYEAYLELLEGRGGMGWGGGS